jgi:cell division transport system permease protein
VASAAGLRLRRLSGGGVGALAPQARLSGPMPWVIAIMVALTVIAVAAGLALRNAAEAAAAELAGGITVQIVEASPVKRDAQANAAVRLLRETPGVASVRLVPREELDALIEPWLGGSIETGDDLSIPVPALIDVRIDQGVTRGRLNAIQATLRGVAPSARVDAQSTWLKPVAAAIDSLQWLAIALVLLLAFALSASVVLAARTALGSNRETIEIVHLLGGSDAQIAGVFQRAIGADAAAGGLVGLIMALVVIFFLASRFAGLDAGLVRNGAFGWADWLLLALVPAGAAVLAMATVRLTVIYALRKML